MTILSCIGHTPLLPLPRLGGILVKCEHLNPGGIVTPMTQAVGKQVAEAIARDPRNKPSVRGTTPGQPDDIGYMVLYLASDESKYTNGAEMIVDNTVTSMEGIVP